MASLLPNSVMHQGFTMFRAFDKDNSKFLDAVELEALLKAMNYTKPFEAAVSSMQLRFGGVSFHSFISWLAANRDDFPSLKTGDQGSTVLEQGFYYFLLYDSNNSGTIDSEEFDVLALDLNLDVNAAAVIAQFDEDGSGVLEFGEFMRWLFSIFPDESSPLNESSSDAGDYFVSMLEAAYEVYRKCDLDKSGYIEKCEYERMAEDGLILPPWDALDADHSGRVEFKELFEEIYHTAGLRKAEECPTQRGKKRRIPEVLERLPSAVATAGNIILFIQKAENLLKAKFRGKDNMYVTARAVDRLQRPVSRMRGKMVSGTLNPVWDEYLTIRATPAVRVVQVEVCDEKNRLRGRCWFDIQQIMSGVNGTFPLRKETKETSYGTISLSIRFEADN